MKKRKSEEEVVEVEDREVVVLCSCCNSELGRAKLKELRYPMYGSMMKQVPNFVSWPNGVVTLDVHCPVCLMFPFEYRTDGVSGGIGRNITILDNGNKVLYSLSD